MSTVTAIYTVDFANTITLTNGQGTLAQNATSGNIMLGKRRIFKIFSRDTAATGGGVISQISMTFGVNGVAPTPVSGSPFFSMNQDMTWDTGDLYDTIQLGNFHNQGTDSIDYSVVILSKF